MQVRLALTTTLLIAASACGGGIDVTIPSTEAATTVQPESTAPTAETEPTATAGAAASTEPTATAEAPASTEISLAEGFSHRNVHELALHSHWPKNAGEPAGMRTT